MSQKKVLLYSPDGKEENWFMEDEAPADWLRHKPQSLDTPKADILKLSVPQSLNSDKTPKLTDDEKLAEAERLQGEGRMEEAEVVLEETQDDGH